MAKKLKFKVGDRVVVQVGKGMSHETGDKKYVGVIRYVDLDTSSWPYAVEFDGAEKPTGLTRCDWMGKFRVTSGNGRWVSASAVSPPDALKVGDLVRLVVYDVAGSYAGIVRDDGDLFRVVDVNTGGEYIDVRSVKTERIHRGCFPWRFIKVGDVAVPAPTFKVGDRVIVNGDQSRNTFKDAHGVVCNIITTPGDANIGVHFDKRFNRGHTCFGTCPDNFGWFVRPDMLKPEPKATPKREDDPVTGPFIVGDIKEEYILISVDAAGKLAPAANPKTYTSKEQAETVASKMSNTHPGTKFFVFQKVASAFTPKAATVVQWAA